jgi:hypothetical protein
MGIRPGRDKNLRVVDSAEWIMAGRAPAANADRRPDAHQGDVAMFADVFAEIPQWVPWILVATALSLLVAQIVLQGRPLTVVF